MGISVDDFPFKERRRREKEPARLLTVGRLVEEKGVEYAIRAVGRLVKQGQRVQYRIIGDGALRAELETLVQHLDLGEVVHLLGAMSREDVKEQYEWAHVFVMPGVTASSGAVETQGLVLAEAQASGLPIVATDAGGIPEGVCEGAGFLVPEKDVSALADRLDFVIEHPEHWPDMGQVGREYVQRKYDTNKLIDELVGLYQQLR